MKKLFLSAFGLLLMAGVAMAQSYLPVPSGIFSAGDVVVAQDGNNLTGSATLTLGASGSAVSQIAVFSATITPAEVTASQCAEQSFTVTGLTSSDSVSVNHAYTAAASAAATTARASSGSDTLLITFCNVSSSNATPTGGTINVLAIRA